MEKVAASVVKRAPVLKSFHLPVANDTIAAKLSNHPALQFLIIDRAVKLTYSAFEALSHSTSNTKKNLRVRDLVIPLTKTQNYEKHLKGFPDG